MTPSISCIQNEKKFANKSISQFFLHPRSSYFILCRYDAQFPGRNPLSKATSFTTTIISNLPQGTISAPDTTAASDNRTNTAAAPSWPGPSPALKTRTQTASAGTQTRPPSAARAIGPPPVTVLRPCAQSQRIECSTIRAGGTDADISVARAIQRSLQRISSHVVVLVHCSR